MVLIVFSFFSVYAIECVLMSEAYLRNKGVRQKAKMSQLVSIIKSPDRIVESSYTQIARKDFLLTTETITKTAATTLNDKFWYHRCLIHCKPIGYVNFSLDCDICNKDNLTKQERELEDRVSSDDDVSVNDLHGNDIDSTNDFHGNDNNNFNVLNLHHWNNDDDDDDDYDGDDLVFYGHETDTNDGTLLKWIRQ